MDFESHYSWEFKEELAALPERERLLKEASFADHAGWCHWCSGERAEAETWRKRSAELKARARSLTSASPSTQPSGSV